MQSVTSASVAVEGGTMGEGKRRDWDRRVRLADAREEYRMLSRTEDVLTREERARKAHLLAVINRLELAGVRV